MARIIASPQVESVSLIDCQILSRQFEEQFFVDQPEASLKELGFKYKLKYWDFYEEEKDDVDALSDGLGETHLDENDEVEDDDELLSSRNTVAEEQDDDMQEEDYLSDSDDMMSVSQDDEADDDDEDGETEKMQQQKDTFLFEFICHQLKKKSIT